MTKLFNKDVSLEIILCVLLNQPYQWRTECLYPTDNIDIIVDNFRYIHLNLLVAGYEFILYKRHTE